jgi:hypothetical protein
MRRLRYTLVGMLGTIAFGPAVSFADTLNLQQFSPITFCDLVDMKYRIVSDGSGGKIGMFTATGTAEKIDGVQMRPTGTLSLTAYFSPMTGTLIETDPSHTFDPNLSVKNGSGTELYGSSRIYEFAYNLTTSLPTFDFLWRKDRGTLALASSLPFIGVTLRNTTSFTWSGSTKSFAVPTASIGTMVFDNKLNVAGLEGGTANVFMTPAPRASAGAMLLLAGLATALAAKRSGKGLVR